MWIGDVVADRFVIQRPIGAGGMGSVFLAIDRTDGNPVAVKVLELASESGIERFRRETRFLSELSHPGIVRYIAHGETEERQPFFAMEFLEGMNLADQLGRSWLSPEASIALVRRAAEALAFGHERGVVHRDVKPSNLFLVDGDIERLKVLDFGIARGPDHTRWLTETGAMLGTVGYMAPEQATGARDVDARADVFALGCVLFECLTGRPAFAGDHAVAVLAKVLKEEAPRVSEFRPGLGGALDALVARLLAKDPAARPADAGALLHALDSLGPQPAPTTAPASSESPRSLTRSEQKVVAVILAERAGHAAASRSSTPEHTPIEIESAREIAARFGAELSPLPGRALVFVLSGKGAASDQAIRAASCALAVERALPELRLSLATGRAETTGRLPVGAAIDRAAAVLRAPDRPANGTVVDDVTAVLISPRFVLRRESAFHVLVGDTGEVERPRLLMGKPTPTVGREKELGLLDATLAECIDDSVARVVLVTAPPGTGKSRLGSEFMARARRSGRARVLVARGEAAGGASLVRGLVWKAAGLREEDSLVERQARFFAYMSALFPDATDRLTADFLGESVGVPSPHAPSPELIAARNDPRLMSDQLRRAVPAWIAAECAREPLVLVLEDLHWADSGSVAHVQELLSRLGERPLFVLALARPEARDLFPKLWDRTGAQELKLDGLTRRAAQRLAQAVLGENADIRVVSRIVEHAGGNAFYLEELIRAAAEGRDELPETIMAMATSRLERLEPEARRVLRAASVFGEAFWAGGVSALLDGDAGVGTWLGVLAEREVLDRVAESRFAGEREFAFRHALLRDAAYGMLTESDRVTGHALAAEWLAAREDSEPTVVAEHFERGGRMEHAASWFVRALLRSLNRGTSLMTLRELADRALSAGASGSERGSVRAAQARAWLTSDLRATLDAGREATRLLPVTDPAWFWGAGAIMRGAAFSGNAAAAAEILQTVMSVDPMPRATGPMGWCLFSLTYGMLVFARPRVALQLLGRFEDAAAAARSRGDDVDPAFLGYQAVARCLVVSLAQDDVPAGLSVVAGADEHFLRGGDLRSMPHAVLYGGLALFNAGRIDPALRELDRARRLDIEHENTAIASLALAWTGMVLATAGRPEARELLFPFLTEGTSLTRPVARIELAASALRAADAESAERLLPALANVETEAPPVYHRPMLALHAGILVARGAVEEAVAIAARAATAQEQSPMLPHYRSIVLLTHAECLHAAGRHAEAEDAIRRARDRLLLIASGFSDDATRNGFLTNLEPNRRTLELANEWLGEQRRM